MALTAAIENQDESAPPIMWRPDPGTPTNLGRFMDWLATAHNRTIHVDEDGPYRAIWRWSVENVSEFWDAVRRFHGVIGTGFEGPALARNTMPGAIWYPQARLNFAENLLRWADDPELADRAAIVQIEEDNRTTEITWAQLRDRVHAVASHLRTLGIQPGDRVAAVLPNIPEAIIGLLSTAAIGATWTISSPDLSVTATLNRLRQLEPSLLIGTHGYVFQGRRIDLSSEFAQIATGLPTVRHAMTDTELRTIAAARPAGEERHPGYHRVPFDHPLWVLFSSGTTGAPKGIVHGHGGITLEALKGTGLQQDMGPKDRYYVAANTSWMVWNTLVMNLISGASVVTYAGSPKAGDIDRQFEIISLTGATMFATGAAYLSLVEKSGLIPRNRWDLRSLRSILSTGSPLPESTWRWVHHSVKDEVHLGSDSGGTDICSGFLGSNPLEPVHLGELQGPLLGVDVQAWNADGHRVREQIGDMVVLQPMPSMPVCLWNDPDGSRYRETYFSAYPEAEDQPCPWVQGDWITETGRGTFIVHGRSDATLNRAGVRLGSADIYAAMQYIPEVKESMVIGVEHPGGYYMPLFVALADRVQLTTELEERIRSTIRSHASARHVPDTIIEAPAVPVTHAGKRIEVPIKRLFLGHDASSAVNPDALSNPECLPFYFEEVRRFFESRDRGGA